MDRVCQAALCTAVILTAPSTPAAHPRRSSARAGRHGEYQYYEFLAVDPAARCGRTDELRAISTRARISSTSFVNSYEWGDLLKADPLELLKRHFDVFVSLPSCGHRRLAFRLPKAHFDPACVERFELGDLVSVRPWKSHVILDIERNEEDPGEWDDGSGWLASLAPLRADLLDGDLGLFHLLWLIEVQAGAIDGGALEPLPDPGPLSAPLAALAGFLAVGGDLLDAAYGASSPVSRAEPDRRRGRVPPLPRCRMMTRRPVAQALRGQ
jgi:hypothetical protein